MKGDFTRRTFHSRNHYRQVLQQQGRVQLDADWNEQADIQAHLDRTTTLDTVGTHGGPLHAAGMAITCDGGDIAAGCKGEDLRISAGRYYVDGILCENEDAIRLADQPDLPGVELPTSPGLYVAYLDVWAEHVTALEQPALREVALGGPETATRSRTIWQLRLEGVPDETTCTEVAPPWAPDTESTGQLRARAEAPATSSKPCAIPATAGYRRLENQLYRVEIHDDSDAAGGPTFVWSRDNGSVVARLVTIVGNVVTIDAPGRDEQLGFAKDNWVEVIDVARARRGERGFLGRLDKAEGTTLTVAEWRGAAPTSDQFVQPALVRRWDSKGALPVGPGSTGSETDNWIDLEDGVQVQFQDGGHFRTGDYWLIPARTANLQGGQTDPDLAGDVEWPRDSAGAAVFQPRAGIEHRFAAVALLNLAEDRWTLVSDCRRLFAPLAEPVPALDMEYAGGDGQEAMPGDPLRQPLEVSVSDGPLAVPGVKVRFTAATDDTDGGLAETEAELATSTASSIDATTGPNGVARCYWRPASDVTRPSQRVTARLLDAGGAPIDTPVDFTASLSIAARVWFNPGTCAVLTGVQTVQAALERLASARSLVAVGGDGQLGQPGAILPLPAEVLVRASCGPVEGATVRCTVASGAVAADPDDLGAGEDAVEITTDENGVGRCFWQLGDDDPVQVLTAALFPGAVEDEPPVQLAFTASLQQLAGIHVTSVVRRGDDELLLNDSVVTADELLDGIGVVLDRAPLKELVDDKPVLALTLDLPFPSAASDQALWGEAVIGTQPMTLAADIALDTTDAPTVTWTPTPEVQGFLTERLFAGLTQLGLENLVLAHLTLTGRALADSDGPDRQVLNGLALGRPRADGTALELPTVDDVRGADFTLWFKLVPGGIILVIVPARAGLFRLKSVRDAVTLAVPGEQLRAVLAPQVRVQREQPDPDAARRSADRAFNGSRPERRLVVVVDERYADAATALRDALGRIDVNLEVISSADPATAAQERINAGDQLDGVLTTSDNAGPIADLGSFSDPIPL
ncbi:MAG: DUF6519 domain-containing protein [Pseudonocardiaceae bacterium]